MRLTRARALREGEDLKAATAECVALAAESADWDDDPGSHAMIAAETAVLLGESGEFARAREAAEQALAARGAYEDALAALDKALELLGEPGTDDGRAGEWAECIRLAAAVEGLYLERPAPVRTRLDAAISA